MKEQTAESSPALMARIAGVFYVLNIVTSIFAFFDKSSPRLAFVCGLLATACYITVPILFYYLFKPVNRGLSLIAAFFSMAGSTVGVLSSLHINIFHINLLVFFGFYCLLIGYLILKSTFLPKILGVLMVFAGLGWLTFISSSLAKFLNPYNMVPGGVGEGLLTLWILIMGVNAQRWKEQANAAGQRQ